MKTSKFRAIIGERWIFFPTILLPKSRSLSQETNLFTNLNRGQVRPFWNQHRRKLLFTFSFAENNNVRVEIRDESVQRILCCGGWEPSPSRPRETKSGGRFFTRLEGGGSYDRWNWRRKSNATEAVPLTKVRSIYTGQLTLFDKLGRIEITGSIVQLAR